jgi:hypothetical protein
MVSGPFLFVGFSGQRDALIIGVVLVSLGIVGMALLAQLRFAISSEGISYRSVTKTRNVPLTEIATIQAEFGAERFPAYTLTVVTLPDATTQAFRINIKPFRRSDLRRFFRVAEQLRIPIKFDDLIARLLNR